MAFTGVIKHMSDLQFKSPAELQVELGRRIRQLRLHRNIDQRTLAEKAGIALTALQKLEAGRGLRFGPSCGR